MTQFAHIPLEQIYAHPNNPRRHAVADQELVDSLKAVGQLQAVLVAPAAAGEGYTLIGGHRRLDGLRKAGATTAAAMIRTDLVTDAQQLEAMLVENGRRSDLTPIEEAAGYAQLELFGYKPKDIAHATGVSAATVKARLKLNALPESSREKLHDGQLTLGDAEALLEFADEPQVLAELERKIGSANFRYAVSAARDERDRRARRAAHAKEISAGFAFEPLKFDGPYPAWNNETGPTSADKTGLNEAASHIECGRIYWPPSLWQDPFLVCIDPGRHPKPQNVVDADQEAAKARAERDAEWEAKRAAREAELAAHRAAAKVRIDHMVKHFAGLYTTKTVPAAQLAALRVSVPFLLRTADGTFDADAYMHAMRIEGTTFWSVADIHAGEVAAMTPAKFLKAYAALQAAYMEVLLSDTSEPGSATAWQWLLSTDYQPSDIDAGLQAEAIDSAA